MKITNSAYSNNLQMFIRFISILATIILIISNTRKIEIYGLRTLINSKLEFFAFVINCISIVLFFLIIIFPTKLGLMSLIPFLYGCIILLFEPANNMGVFIFGLSIITLYARGFFNKHKKTKNIIMLVVFLGLIISEIRFGKEIFLVCFLEKLACSFILFLCLFFFQIYTFDLFETTNSVKKLDIQKFPELQKRDAKWLAEIQNGVKYDALAFNSQMSIGSVKNRLKIIFCEIGVGDKQGFLNKYSDYEICYGNDFSSSKKKTKLFHLV